MIGVLGAGSWGTALAIVLANKHPDQNIQMWGHEPAHLAAIRAQRKNQRYLPDITLPSNISCIDNLAELMAVIDDVLLVVPSNVFSLVLKQIKPYFTKRHRLIWATKGLDATTGKFLHQVVKEQLGNQFPCAVLAGPSFAKEVALGLPTAVTIASEDAKFAADLVTHLHSKIFRIYLNTDLIGAQLGGVVKNILAVAAGISDGLQFGANARAALITRGMVELNNLGRALGAKSETLLGLSGLGDVILCTTDNQSRNKRFGMALATGKTTEAAQLEIGQVVEAVHNVAAICKLATEHKVETPIIAQVNLIIRQEITAKAAVEQLLARHPVYE